MPSLPYWLFPGDERPPDQIDGEITEELRLHVDLLAEEQMRQGVEPDEARRRAAQRFGDLDSLVRRCRLEKQGDIPMLKRVQAVLTALVFAAVVLMGVRQWASEAATAQYMDQTTTFLTTIQSDVEKLTQTMAASTPSTEAPPEVEPTPALKIWLRGRVRDDQGRLLPEASTLFSWRVQTPEGVTTALRERSLQHYGWAKSDIHGHVFDQLDVQDRYVGSYAITVAAAAPGRRLTLVELSRRAALDAPPEPFNIRLPRASQAVVEVKDANGEGLSDALVYVSKYLGANGTEFKFDVHQLNKGAIGRLAKDFDGTLAWRTANAGRFIARSFAVGDRVTVDILPDGGAWSEATFSIDDGQEPIVVTID